jgi:hypothetical protein
MMERTLEDLKLLGLKNMLVSGCVYVKCVSDGDEVVTYQAAVKL